MVVAIVSVVVVCGEHGWMVETKVYTKEEYVTLIPPVSSADYERLKNSRRTGIVDTYHSQPGQCCDRRSP
ncbi:MAG: hypothetical protein WCC17_03235 [Candidatus Nitrosopolaris sp.]